MIFKVPRELMPANSILWINVQRVIDRKDRKDILGTGGDASDSNNFEIES